MKEGGHADCSTSLVHDPAADGGVVGAFGLNERAAHAALVLRDIIAWGCAQMSVQKPFSWTASLGSKCRQATEVSGISNEC